MYLCGVFLTIDNICIIHLRYYVLHLTWSTKNASITSITVLASLALPGDLALTKISLVYITEITSVRNLDGLCFTSG